MTLVRDVLPGAGLFVLTGLPAAAGEVASRRIAGLLGETLPQNREGTIVREVRDRGTAIAEGERARYSDSRFGGHLHTDGVEAPLPAPDYFTLFCVRQSEVGGSLRLVHIRDVLTALAGQPDLLGVLRAPFHFDRCGDQEEGIGPTVAKPVLFTQHGRPAIAYFRSYIERGHEHPGILPLTPAQVAALDALDEAAYASDPGIQDSADDVGLFQRCHRRGCLRDPAQCTGDLRRNGLATTATNSATGESTTTTYAYNADGETTSLGNESLTWNNNGTLATAGSTSCIYDADGAELAETTEMAWTCPVTP
jgi:hypothetical protein